MNGESGDRERSAHQRRERDRHLLAKTAHVPHVLLAVHSRESPSRAEEQQRFEERVRHYVEDARENAPTPHARNM